MVNLRKLSHKQRKISNDKLDTFLTNFTGLAIAWSLASYRALVHDLQKYHP